MRFLLFVLGICVSAISIGTPAEANYPWCAQYGGALGGAKKCNFTSFQHAWPMSGELVGSAYKIVHIIPHVVLDGCDIDGAYSKDSPPAKWGSGVSLHEAILSRSCPLC
jgi:hypothetical protein